MFLLKMQAIACVLLALVASALGKDVNGLHDLYDFQTTHLKEIHNRSTILRRLTLEGPEQITVQLRANLHHAANVLLFAEDSYTKEKIYQLIGANTHANCKQLAEQRLNEYIAKLSTNFGRCLDDIEFKVASKCNFEAVASQAQDIIDESNSAASKCTSTMSEYWAGCFNSHYRKLMTNLEELKRSINETRDECNKAADVIYKDDYACFINYRDSIRSFDLKYIYQDVSACVAMYQ